MKKKVTSKKEKGKDTPTPEINFKFKTLAERLKSINIDVIHKVGRIPSNPEDASTFFLETIQKWRDLNYTEDYVAIQKEIGPDIRTLSQLVFRKDEIIDVLVKHLSKVGSLALEAVLELVVALARDLQFEFYPHFPKLFEAICIHFYTKDTDLLEQLFTCLAYLFKFLWKYMVKDIKSVYSIFFSLLSRKISKHIREFAVESFAFLLRKVADKEELFKFMFSQLKGKPRQNLGVGPLLFEVVKGVKQQFHSCTIIVLKTLLNLLGKKHETEDAELPINGMEIAIKHMLISMANHTTQEHCIIVQDILCDAIAEHLDRFTSDGLTNDSDHLRRLLKLFYVWISFNKGKLVTSTEKISETLAKLCKLDSLPDDCMNVITYIIPFILISGCIKVSVENISLIMQKIYQSASNEEVLSFTKEMFRYGMFEKDVLPNLLTHCVDQLNKEDTLAQSYVLHILSVTVSALRPVVKCVKHVKSFKKLHLFSPVKRNVSRSEEDETLLTSNVMERFIIETVANHEDALLLETKFAEIWSSLICLPHLRFFNVNYVRGIVEGLIFKIYNYLLNSQSLSSEISEPHCYILYQAYVTWLCISKDCPTENSFDLNFFIGLLRQYPTSVSVLRMTDLFFDFQKISVSVEEIGKELVVHMINNLASPFHLVRLHTLQILCALKYKMPIDNSAQGEYRENVFSICLKSEKIPIQFYTYRENLKFIHKLEYPFVNHVIPIDFDELNKAPLYYLFGVLYINFRLLWLPCIKVIETHAHGFGKTFWNAFLSHFEEVTELCEKNLLISRKPCDESCDSNQLEYFFNSNMKAFCKPVEKPDVINHRSLLFSAMVKFPNIIESENKSFVPFLFRFLKNELERKKVPSKSLDSISKISLTKSPEEPSIPMDDDSNLNSIKRKRKILQKSNKCKKRKIIASENKIDDESALLESEDEYEDTIHDTETSLNVTEDIIEPLMEDSSGESSEENSDSEEETPLIISQNNPKRNSALVTVTGNSDEETPQKSLQRNKKRKSSFGAKHKNVKSKKQKKSFSEIENDTKDESILSKADSEAASDDIEASLNITNNSVENLRVKSVNSHKQTRKVSQKTVTEKRRQNVKRTLCSFLIILSRFKNPRKLHHSEQLVALYDELLCYTDSSFQKMAFNCIMSYKHEYLMPYKENFQKLFKTHTFRSELSKFSVNSEDSVVLEEHRVNVANILMRLLFGKIHVKPKKKDRHFQQTLIFRFLAGCRQEEIQIFLDLVFKAFKDDLKDDTLQMVLKIRQNLDLSATHRIRKLRSAINSMSIILSNLGNLVPELLSWLLKVLLLITSTSTALLEKRHEILPQCISLLKSVRILSMMRLIQFFEAFIKYPFTPEEVDAVFEAIVWPMVPRLKSESRNAPSPLLQLFEAWSENPRYFILFTKQKDSSNSLSCFPHIISLYAHPQTKLSVVKVISNIIYNLLTLKESRLHEEIYGPPLKVNYALSESTENLEVTLLQPYVDHILKRMKMLASAAVIKKNASCFSEIELTILLRICKFVEGDKQCCNLIELVLPFLTRKSSSPESEVLILSTILNLIEKVKEHEYIARILSPLFETLENPNSRSVLVKIFSTIANMKGSVSEIALIISKVNAWDENFIHQPDFTQRFDGHKQALQQIKSMDETSVDVDFCKLMIFNSFFVISTAEDMALRDNASQLLKDIIDFFSAFQQSSALYKDIIFLTILPLIQKKLALENESIRHEFISILAHVLRKNMDNPKLQELTALCDDNPDVDFWENIQHLQMHNRAKALRRLSTSINSRLEKGENFNVQIILKYLKPIVTNFISNPSYNSQTNVIDAAIEVIGAIACIMSWNQYEPFLTTHLNLLFTRHGVNPKTAIKVAVAIINAFHFDVFMDDDYENNSLQHSLKNKKKDYKKNIAVGKTLRKKDNKIMNTELAAKIYHALTRNIIPTLHRAIMKKTKNDDEHKLAKTSINIDNIELRVPIALALVKLLQKLPVKILDSNLPGLFLKLCESLRFKHESVRNTARVTLTKIMQSVGPKYFHVLLFEMSGVLTKGYQFHVMMSSINTVLISLADQFKCGDLDSSVDCLTKICMQELFSDVAEEKEVIKIIQKWKEAETTKSYSIYQVLSQFVSERFLFDLILPLKEVMSQKLGHKEILKVKSCLKSIALGLCENKSLSTKALLIFIHAVCTENSPQLNPERTIEPAKKEVILRPDIYLIPAEPGRKGPPAKINVRSNAHIFVEFGFGVLLFSLKKQKIDVHCPQMQGMLDPFVGVIAECLNSDYVKIISDCLRCLMLLYAVPLPSLKIHSSAITSSLFVLLNKCACVGMNQGDSFEMVVMCFKMLAMIVKNPNYNQLTTDQLHVLLSYVEQDLSDHTKQSTAFSLLKAILSRTLQSPVLREMMCHLAEMSITSEEEFVRSRASELCRQYMSTYPLGKKLKTSISFFLSQLDYSVEHGRVSALETIDYLLSNLPQEFLKEHSGLFFIPLAARLVNDDSMQCRKMSSHCMQKLLQKVENDCRNNLFDVVLTWLQSDKLAHQRLGAQIFGIFAAVEMNDFELRISQVLPMFIKHLKEAKFVKPKCFADERCTDHFLYHLLNAFTKAISFCPIIKKKEFSDELSQIWELSQGLILHPHSWVRLAMSQLFGFLFSVYKADEISSAINNKKENEPRMCFIASRQKIRDMSADFCTQFQSPYLNATHGRQVIRNLVYLAKVLSELPVVECDPEKKNFKLPIVQCDPEKNDSKLPMVQCDPEKNDSKLPMVQCDPEKNDSKLPMVQCGPEKKNYETPDDENVVVSLPWMIRKLNKIVGKELAYNRQLSFEKRKLLFMFMGAISHELSKETIVPLLNIILWPLCREMDNSSKGRGRNLKRSVKEILNIIKEKVGDDDFHAAYAEVQSAISKKKMLRKQERAGEAVTDPQKFAQRRIKRQQSKKESKKRKIHVIKGVKMTPKKSKKARK